MKSLSSELRNLTKGRRSYLLLSYTIPGIGCIYGRPVRRIQFMVLEEIRRKVEQ